MPLAEEIREILAEKPSRWLTIEQLDAIDAAYQKSPEYAADKAEQEAQLDEPFEITRTRITSKDNQLCRLLEL
jgi:hypothetical protein